MSTKEIIARALIISLLLNIWIVLNDCRVIYASRKNLIMNGDFERDVNHDGVPDGWRVTGSKNIIKKLGIGRGYNSERSARLTCLKFIDNGKNNSHVMLLQKGKFSLKKGVVYMLTFRARQRGMRTGCVSLSIRGLYRKKEWRTNRMFQVPGSSTKWKKITLLFKASNDCFHACRLQFWYRETGKLWLDNIELTAVSPDVFKPGNNIATSDSNNLIPNSSFECGADGWGSFSLVPRLPWHGGVNELFGKLDVSTAFHGKASMKIELNRRTIPVYQSDYFNSTRIEIKAPLLGNIGWIHVKKGEKYTLSVYLKSDQPLMIARLGIYNFMGGPKSQIVNVSTSWKRYSIVCRPRSSYIFVMVGPDLKAGNLEHGTIWVDAIQFEEGSKPSEYETQGVEMGMVTGNLGNVFIQGKPVGITVYLQNATGTSQTIPFNIELFDFFDNMIEQKTFKRIIQANKTLKERIVLDTNRTGFFSVRAKMRWAGGESNRKMRIAVIPEYNLKDAIFGVNHAYGWPHTLQLCSIAGIKWFRDWSLRWQEVEPEKGKFNYSQTDDEIDRILKQRLSVLGLLPLPSSSWSSSIPKYFRLPHGYRGERVRMSFLPSNMSDFIEYVKRTVQHYKGKISYWQILNEPLSNYSLPRRYGYKSKDYVSLLKAAWNAAKEIDPRCKILAGFRGLGSRSILNEFEEFFEAGGLNYCDIITVHCYPRVLSPEIFEGPLKELNRLMEKYGNRKTIWMTEHGYYADDDPARIPPRAWNVTSPLHNEIEQASYEIRFSTILLANGIKKIFFHAGNTTKLNCDNLTGTFFKYEETPRKIYAAVALFAHILSPEAVFVKKETLGNKIWAYLFTQQGRFVLVVWKPEPGHLQKLVLGDTRIRGMDIMGNRIKSRTIQLTSTPIYIEASGLTEKQFEMALKMHP